MKNPCFVVVVAIICSLFSVFVYHQFNPKQKIIYIESETNGNIPLAFANYKFENTLEHDNQLMGNFIEAASVANPTVVHLTALPKEKQGSTNWHPFDELLESDGLYNNKPKTSSGSGVIVTKDGYIVTNNHVVSDEGEIQVTLHNKKSYIAKIVGKDPNTDLAVVKIPAKNLPTARYGNSDRVKVGEWVLAVGNPFNLTSTVTAGIVSAKARNLNIVQDDYAIEAFIQTDAAINPGNSGGALVNIRGELVGINTAIATQTGTFAGYSFAVPVNIVRKVVEDLIQHGGVIRGYLGVDILNIDNKLAAKKRLSTMRGIYVERVHQGGGAFQAGIRAGDIIIEINGFSVNSIPQMQERIGRFRPNDPVAVTFIRQGREHFVNVILQDIEQETNLADVLGADFEELTTLELRQLGLRNGIRVKRLRSGLLQMSTGMRPNFIIIKMNNHLIRNVSDLTKYMKSMPAGSRITLEGIYVGEKGRVIYPFIMK